MDSALAAKLDSWLAATLSATAIALGLTAAALAIVAVVVAVVSVWGLRAIKLMATTRAEEAANRRVEEILSSADLERRIEERVAMATMDVMTNLMFSKIGYLRRQPDTSPQDEEPQQSVGSMYPEETEEVEEC